MIEVTELTALTAPPDSRRHWLARWRFPVGAQINAANPADASIGASARARPRAWRAAWLSTARWCATLTLLALAGCATTRPPSAITRTPSQALSANAGTLLQQQLAPSEAAHPKQAGVHLLPTGTEALQMRIALARAAQRTLDLQYYIADEDNTGKLVFEAVLRAADRGVRVRLLIDDFNFKDIDSLMGTLNAHPNIEVRMFNPFFTASESLPERAGNIVTHLDTLTRRMHNKAMIADNQLAIVGGRNIGDEYFDASPSILFRDLDILVAGPVVPPISRSFDQFWNSEQAYPLRQLNHQKFSADDFAKMRATLRTHWTEQAAITEARPINGAPLGEQIANGDLPMLWGPARFWVDTPRKIVADQDDYESPPVERLKELASAARREFLIFSAYFVPRQAGVDLLSSLAAQGVDVRVLTNSLASTDAPAAMAGYMPYRVPLLKAGVRLYEFKAAAGQPRNLSITGAQSRASLHTKTFVIDRQTVVIGSMNLDPRSAGLNTELALEIRSPELANQVAQIFAGATAPHESYQVMLASQQLLDQLKATGSPASPLIWVSQAPDGSPITYNFDPDAGMVRSVMTGIFRMLPIQNQL